MDFINTIENYCTSGKVAHIYRNSNLTYMELKTKSDSLAVNIIELFGDDKTPIIVSGHKDHLMLISFLACIKSGHSYITVDSSTPITRLKEILLISGAKLVAAIMLNEKFEGNIILTVKKFLKDLLPSYMIPRKVKVLGILPMNANGKIHRKKIMEEF